MACNLELQGQIARLRVVIEVGGVKGEPLPSPRPGDELHARLSGIAERAFRSRDVRIESITFERGSIEAIVLVGTLVKLVIDAGGFLAGLREIRDAMPPAILEYVQRLVRGTASIAQTNVELPAAALEAHVAEGLSGPGKPNVPEPVLVLLAAAVIVLAVTVAVMALT